MSNITSSYELMKKITTGSENEVAIIRNRNDGEQYLLKSLNIDNFSHSIERKIRFRRELDIVSSLDHPHIAKPDAIHAEPNGFSIIYPLKTGRPLSELMQDSRPFSLQDALSYTAQLLDALDYIHSRGIIHCDINPNNIFIDKNKGVKLLDFGFSLTPDEADRVPEGKILGVTPYLSPEQMGFTGFSIDNRSDLYCVGQLLYIMIAGNHPTAVQGSTIAEILDYVLKREIQPIRNLPVFVNSILLKSLRPSPEDRYQTAAGFKWDILHSMILLESSANEEFVPGERDAIISINQSNNFVARVNETSAMKRSLQELQSGKGSSLLIWGRSGVGKTEMVSRFLSSVGRFEAIAIEAKCNRLTSHQPHEVLRRIILQLVAVIYEWPDGKKALLQDNLALKLNRYSGIITSIVPDAKGLFSHIGNVEKIEPEKETERVVHAFLQLFITISEYLRIAIFVDDLQWIDKISFEILARSIKDKLRMLIIFGFRAEAASDLHLFGYSLKTIEVHKILELKPFIEKEVISFLHSRFGNIICETQLINCLLERTLGCPSTLAEACRFLVNEGILRPNNNGWHFDTNKKDALPQKFDLSSIVQHKVRCLSTEEQKFLRYSSLIDGEIDIEIIKKLGHFTDRDCAKICQKLHAVGMISRKPFGTVTFVHDKIQETILGSFDIRERLQLFEALGDIYADNQTVNERSVFNAAECYLKSNNSFKAIGSAWTAAQNARSDIAYDVAIRYLKSIIFLLKSTAKQNAESIVNVNMIAVKEQLANVLMLTGNNKQALQLYKDVSSTRNIPQKQLLDCSYNIGLIHHKLGEFDQAIKTFDEALFKLGIKIPWKKSAVLFALIPAVLKQVVYTCGLKYLLPRKTHSATFLSVRILNKLSYSLFFKNLPLSYLSHLLALNLADRLPDCYEKAETYAFHLVAAFQSMLRNRAAKYRKKALGISEKIFRRDALAFGQTFSGLVEYYAARWRAADEFLRCSLSNYESIGDKWGQLTPFEHLAYIAYLKGNFLEAEQTMLKMEALSNGCADLRGSIAARQKYLFIRELRIEQNDQLWSELEKQTERLNDSLVQSGTAVSLAKKFLVRNDIQNAFLAISKAAKLVSENKLFIQEYIAGVPATYCEIIAAEILSRKQGNPQINATNEFLQKQYIRYALKSLFMGFVFPAYWGSGLKSVGVFFSFQKRYRLASVFLKRSIKKHHSLDMRYEEAKSRRDYALFLEECNRPGEARDQFEHAYKLFEQCGAVLETNRLKDRIGIIPQSKKESDSSDGDTRALPVFGADKFRVDALFKVSASMTEIDDTDMLLRQIVRGMIEVTGAQYGCILLEQHDRAQKSLAMDFEGRIMSAGELGYSKAIVDKVHATREIVMTKRGTQELGEEMKEGETETVRSAMCVPLCRAEDYLGCVYLANNLVSGLFSEGSKKAAHILSAQAGILLENAYLMGESRRLNASLDHKVKEQTRDITEKNRQLEDANLKLIESERMKSILSGTLVHDIKNYAAGIEGNLQHLGRRLPDDPRISRIVGVVAESCVDIVSLASNLLDIAKMDEGKMVIRPEPIDIELMQEMLGKFTKNSLFEEKEIVPQINLPDFPVAIKADVYLLQRVFQNILSNAAKYVPRGGEVILSFERGTEEDVICFFNSGPAIPDQDKTILFEKYARLETARSQYSKGLGLFFCKMVMNAHGGRIWVDTNEHGNYFRMAFRKSDIQRVPFRAAS